MGRQTLLQRALLLLLVLPAISRAAAKRQQGLPTVDGQLPSITPQKLSLLDTSFSRKVAVALASQDDEQQAQGSKISVASTTDVADDWVNKLTHKKKPTLGQWFQKLVNDIDEEYSKGEQEYYESKKSGDSSKHYSNEQHSKARNGDEKQDTNDPDFWLFRDDKPDHKHSYGPDHHEGPDHESYHGPDNDHRQYGGPDHRQYSDRDHEQYSGPGHEQYRKDSRRYEEQQYKLEEQYKPADEPHKETESVCVQEVARTMCVQATRDEDSVHYTSSLGCCHAPYGQRYYAEDKYPGEPEYPAYSALMIHQRNSRYESKHDQKYEQHEDRYGEREDKDRYPRLERASVAIAGLVPREPVMPHVHDPARVKYYDSPFVFYPQGGKAECVWNLAYHDAVDVDEHTKQIGIATATCHFNGTMSHCGSPLCEGLTITVSADVYKTYAVSKYPPAATTDPACQSIFGSRIGSYGPHLVPTVGAIGGPQDRALERPTAGAVDRRPSLSDSIADMVGQADKPKSLADTLLQPGAQQPSAPRGNGPSMADLIKRSSEQPQQQHQQQQQQPQQRLGGNSWGPSGASGGLGMGLIGLGGSHGQQQQQQQKQQPEQKLGGHSNQDSWGPSSGLGGLGLGVGGLGGSNGRQQQQEQPGQRLGGPRSHNSWGPSSGGSGLGGLVGLGAGSQKQHKHRAGDAEKQQEPEANTRAPAQPAPTKAPETQPVQQPQPKKELTPAPAVAPVAQQPQSQPGAAHQPQPVKAVEQKPATAQAPKAASEKSVDRNPASSTDAAPKVQEKPAFAAAEQKQAAAVEPKHLDRPAEAQQQPAAAVPKPEQKPAAVPEQKPAAAEPQPVQQPAAAPEQNPAAAEQKPLDAPTVKTDKPAAAEPKPQTQPAPAAQADKPTAKDPAPSAAQPMPVPAAAQPVAAPTAADTQPKSADTKPAHAAPVAPAHAWAQNVPEPNADVAPLFTEVPEPHKHAAVSANSADRPTGQEAQQAAAADKPAGQSPEKTSVEQPAAAKDADSPSSPVQAKVSSHGRPADYRGRYGRARRYGLESSVRVAGRYEDADHDDRYDEEHHDKGMRHREDDHDDYHREEEHEPHHDREREPKYYRREPEHYGDREPKKYEQYEQHEHKSITDYLGDSFKEPSSAYHKSQGVTDYLHQYTQEPGPYHKGAPEPEPYRPYKDTSEPGPYSKYPQEPQPYSRYPQEQDKYSQEPGPYRKDTEEPEPYSKYSQEPEPYSKYSQEPSPYGKYTPEPTLYGGETIIIAGVITSVKGLGRHLDYHRGMIEHVAAFDGVPLTKHQYEALPYDTPHIKPGAYKIVFMEDDKY